MAKQKKPQRKFVTISLPRELVEEIDDVLSSGHAYESRPEFVKDAVRRRIEELRQRPRFINLNPNGDFPADSVKIWDRELEGTGRVVEVFFSRDGARCSYCERSDCIHVRHAWNIPYVATQLIIHGLRPPKLRWDIDSRSEAM
ncbi:MAG: ribbon-helix-helix domain-containing protein [Nitrososphaerota archaeon]